MKPTTPSKPKRRPAGCEVLLQNPGRYSVVASRPLRHWLEELVAELAPKAASLVVRFTGDTAIRRLNRLYRDKDVPTDVLSFPGEVTPEGDHLGDVVISVPAALRQAEAGGHSPQRELKVLLLHGLLHCLGHDHETDEGRMERLERQLRRRWIHDD